MQFVHKRRTETRFERSTKEDTVVGSNQVRRQVNERGCTSETVDESVEIGCDWVPADQWSGPPPTGRLSVQAEPHKQLGSG